MTRKKKTVDEVIMFILANAPPDNQEADKPFPRTGYHLPLVDSAIKILRAQHILLDLEIYDIRGTKHMWRTNGDINYDLARRATTRFIQALQEERTGVSLERILPTAKAKIFDKFPINRFKTTLNGLLQHATEDHSPYDALMNVINYDPEYASYRDFRPFDMLHSPRETWMTGNEVKDRTLAREATAQFLTRMSNEWHLPFEAVIPRIKTDTILTTPINRYGTRLGKVYEKAYRASLYLAFKDWAESDERYRHLLPLIEKIRHPNI